MNTPTPTPSPDRRRRTLVLVLALLALPAMVALVEATVHHLAQRNNGSLISSGERREYLLHVPESYDPGRPTPLVISLHGGAVSPALHRDISLWNPVADRHGFLVVYPAAVEVAGIRGWRTWGVEGLDRDIRFIEDLIDDLASRYHLDPSRIYANGFSNGGAMTFVLACQLSHRLAAIGTVAAARHRPADWCADGRPMPVIAFDGTADHLVPYGGGTSWASPSRPFTPIDDRLEGWLRRNRCRLEARVTSVAADVTRREGVDCAAPVTYFAIEGGGHTWPGGGPLPEWFSGPTSHSIDATEILWSHFAEHRLVEPLRPEKTPSAPSRNGKKTQVRSFQSIQLAKVPKPCPEITDPKQRAPVRGRVNRARTIEMGIGRSSTTSCAGSPGGS